MTVFLTHPALPDLGSSVHLVLGDFEPDGSGEIFLTVHLDEPGDDIGPEWHLDGYGRIYPSTRVLPDSGLPEEFGPWTYVSGAGRTDPLRGQLASLPVFASGPLGSGWLVRPVEHPRDQPMELFRDALDALDREPVSYRSARLAPGLIRW